MATEIDLTALSLYEIEQLYAAIVSVWPGLIGLQCRILQ